MVSVAFLVVRTHLDGASRVAVRQTELVLLLCKQRLTRYITILRLFVLHYPGEPVPEETLTHSHLYCSSIILYLCFLHLLHP